MIKCMNTGVSSTLLLSMLCLQSRRASCLRDTLNRLRTGDPDDVSSVHSMLPAIWPQMLSLLGDPNLEVRQFAASIIGQLGALAARKGARPGKWRARSDHFI
jgi:HEAT repeat protein